MRNVDVDIFEQLHLITVTGTTSRSLLDHTCHPSFDLVLKSQGAGSRASLSEPRVTSSPQRACHRALCRRCRAPQSDVFVRSTFSLAQTAFHKPRSNFWGCAMDYSGKFRVSFRRSVTMKGGLSTAAWTRDSVKSLVLRLLDFVQRIAVVLL
jgi:hypothetical protein